MIGEQCLYLLPLAVFFFADFFAVALPLDLPAVADLPLPKAVSQPSAYFLLVPTRTIVTVAYLTRSIDELHLSVASVAPP